MKDKTVRQLWQYCYRQARQINIFLRAAKVEMEAGRVDNALWNAMEAGDLINRAETGYSSTGSVYVYRLSNIVEFDVHTANGDRHEFIFPFGDNTPQNKRAGTNRGEWQNFARMSEHQAEINRKKRRLYEIIGTVSDGAIEHIYNSATVWEVWDRHLTR